MATSENIVISGTALFIALIARQFRFSSSQDRLACESLSLSSIFGKRATPMIPSSNARFATLIASSIEYREIPGIDMIGSFLFSPGMINKGKPKVYTDERVSRFKRLIGGARRFRRRLVASRQRQAGQQAN